MMKNAPQNRKHTTATLNVLLLLVVFCGSGATCSRSFRNPFAAQLGPPAPEVLLTGSSLDQVIAAVNQNSSRIVSYQSNDASITIPGIPGIPLLRGNIAAQRPGRVRMRASTAITGEEMDLGSNDELFWFWVKRNEPPALYFSRHDQFVGSAAQQLMPVEPQWLLDALGMMQFSPTDHHEGPVPHSNGTVEIRSVVQSRGGTMTKNTVVDARRAWVLEQHIYAPTGALLASAIARSHRYYPEIGASLPQEIDLRLPAMQMSLTIDVGTVAINQLGASPQLWSLPAMSGVQQIDLGSAPPGGVAPISTAASKDRSTWASPDFVGLAPQVDPFASQIAVTPQQQDPPLIQRRVTPPPVPASSSQPIAQGLPPGGIPASTYSR